MSSSTSSPGLLGELCRGRVRWELLRPFPEHDPADRAVGDRVIAELTALLHEHVDPEAVDRAAALPDGLVERLRAGGFLSLTMGPDLGGLDLSPMNTVRVIEAAAGWCVPVAWMLAISNGFGAGAYLPLLADGPLKDLITSHVAAGSLSGSADTEVGGAANETRATTAVLDGEVYRLTGEKIFIGNAPSAGLVDVSATVRVDGVDQVRIFFVPTDLPGVEVAGAQEFLGLKGSSVGVLRFHDVRVPAEYLLPTTEDSWRAEPALVRIAIMARMLVIAAPSLAIAKQCLYWQRDFVRRRQMDGKALGDYEEVQRIVARSAAEVFAMDSLVEWGMLGADLGAKVPEFTAAKNLISLACWRVVDSTLSLLAGEGFETATSKSRRGAPPFPVERAFRDARGLRVAGGVDFLLDYWSGLAAIDGAEAESSVPVEDSALTGPCAEHLRALVAEATRFAGLRARLHEGARQHEVVLAGRISGGLLSMAATLARAAHLADRGDPGALDLADIACVDERRRLAAAWAEFAPEPDCPDYTAMSKDLLHGDRLDRVIGHG
ncbi:acyl-CoA dehydrogenase family protein [Actinokineospora sp. HUAS TT18]|uniref:acyl-CoA dehydrogenase family protein n=1 Tax=Actinokineospora sp. HUAS TT18 TaxID=3447451 RepID=UPI003F5260B7